MRNYSEATVVSTEAFRGTYRIALSWARSRQTEASGNVSYTIDNDTEDSTRGIVTKHEGLSGGVPPYQPIVHSKDPVSLSNQ